MKSFHIKIHGTPKKYVVEYSVNGWPRDAEKYKKEIIKILKEVYDSNTKD